jgi:hypothetical protein
MEGSLSLVQDRITPTLERYAEVMGRTLASTIKRAAKGVTRRVISITPPASAETTGAAAYRQGRRKIEKQIDSVLAPVKLKGRRKITTVFGRKIGKPVYVPTKERFPDVAATLRSRIVARGGDIGLRLNRGAKAFVDVRKVKAIIAAKNSRVGVLASGWQAAAAALDVPVQQWISRHGGGAGRVTLDFFTARMHVTAENFATGVPAAVRGALSKRIIFALQYQKAAMEREIDYIVFKKAQDNAIATRNWSALVPAGMMGGDDSA